MTSRLWCPLSQTPPRLTGWVGGRSEWCDRRGAVSQAVLDSKQFRVFKSEVGELTERMQEPVAKQARWVVASKELSFYCGAVL